MHDPGGKCSDQGSPVGRAVVSGAGSSLAGCPAWAAGLLGRAPPEWLVTFDVEQPACCVSRGGSETRGHGGRLSSGRSKHQAVNDAGDVLQCVGLAEALNQWSETA